MIVMLSKKGKLLKTLIMAKCEEVGGQGGELGGSGKESRGRPRPIRWPTGRTALANRADGLGRPVDGCGRGRSRVRALISRKIQK